MAVRMDHKELVGAMNVSTGLWLIFLGVLWLWGTHQEPVDHEPHHHHFHIWGRKK
jgi:hypothetical protein